MLGVALAGGVCCYRFIAPYESADDAAIEGQVRPVAAQVSGRVERLLVRDNQEVKKGDLLLEIDPREYEVELSQADARLTGAYARLGQAAAQFATKPDQSHTRRYQNRLR
jgi:membrane fusion protein (multidrug efflux system)